MIDVKHVANDGFVVVVDTPFSIEAFKELVHRATNLWPDAPPEIKVFADEITNFEWHIGPLQDYKEQDTSTRKKKEIVKKFTAIAITAPCELCGKRYAQHLGKFLRCPHN